MKNLALAFPDRDESWRLDLLSRNHTVLARLLVDFIRLPRLNSEWVERHISCSQKAELEEIKRGAGDGGILFLTGHFGSFELLPLFLLTELAPLAFVAREFKPRWFDRWWNSIRQQSGNTLIQRTGALREIVKHLKRGIDVGVLFDQNVTRNNAVFVDWFGKPAATSVGIGAAALLAKAPIVLIAIRSTGLDSYRVEIENCDCSDIYGDSTLSKDEKILEITRRAVVLFEEVIRKDPASWFWMHRRWKTTSHPDIPEDFYRDVS